MYAAACQATVGPACAVSQARVSAGKVLLDAEPISRTLSRIAHEIIRRNPEPDEFVGEP